VLPSHELLSGGRRWSTRGDEVGEKGRERIKNKERLEGSGFDQWTLVLKRF
jgi:hypothetical protein